METAKDSWHSVNEVTHDGVRCCVSNYYFSAHSPDEREYFHATSFRGEPGQRVLDFAMRVDNALHTTVLKLFGSFYKNPHVYKRALDNPLTNAPGERSGLDHIHLK